jgi:DNA-binding CsgD family transcriptional regulator
VAELVGRTHEVATLSAFLDDVASGSAAACLVTGESGIGKSTLLREAMRSASDRGFTVLSHRAAPAEAELAMAGLTDVLGSVNEHVLGALTPRLRAVLEVVLLQRESEGVPLEERLVGTAVTAVLHELSTAPLLIAVDDALWLDVASARALAFAARRLVDRPIGWLLVRRLPDEPAVPLGINGALPGDRLREVIPGPLSVAAIFRIVKERFDVMLPRPQLLRVHEASGGNPFFALELARVLSAPMRSRPGQPIELPTNLAALVRDRVASLSEDGRRALLVAAAAPHASAAVVASAASTDGLNEIERAGVVRVDVDRVVFDHPLVRSAVYSGATSGERRAAHARLAALSQDTEARGRHLALAATQPDASVAGALDAAVDAARRRGALHAAAELAELAVMHTANADADDGWRRRLSLAELTFDSGNASRARALMKEFDLVDVPEHCRAAALRLKTLVVVETEGGDTALAELASARRALSDDVKSTIEALVLSARIADEGARSAEFAAQALALLDSLPPGTADPAQYGEALLAAAGADFRLGKGLDEARYAKAIELEAHATSPRKGGDRASAAFAALLKYADRFQESHDALLAEYDRTKRTGDDAALAGVVAHLPQAELWLGHWDEAQRWADEHLSLAQQTEQAGQVCTALSSLASLAAYRGDLETARARADESRQVAIELGDQWAVERANAVLGFAYFAQGDAARAVANFETAWNEMRDEGMVEPGYVRWPCDYAEALIQDGQHDAAAAVLDDIEERADMVDRAAVRATALRARALLAAATGDVAAGLDLVEQALQQHARADVPFERARTLMVQGQLHRRVKEKSRASASLTAALEEFERLGAAGWAARARDELRRVNVRPSAPTELTESERRVAELAASGLTNRQVAEAAFISPKTVEANLARVYRKLGISSRAELGQRMAQM